MWIEFCASLLRTAEHGDGGANVDLLGHLPPGCGITELYWLRDYLPAKYRVTESMLRAEQNDSDDDDDDAGGLLFEKDLAQDANASVKLQLFGNLLHSLVLQVGPFVFVIEDLQWLDSSSWKMLVQMENWTHGLMTVCTTRPCVPLHAASFYTSVCKSDSTRREILGPLDGTELTSLASRHLKGVKMSVSSSLTAIERLKTLSSGFPVSSPPASERAQKGLAAAAHQQLPSLLCTRFARAKRASGSGAPTTSFSPLYSLRSPQSTPLAAPSPLPFFVLTNVFPLRSRSSSRRSCSEKPRRPSRPPCSDLPTELARRSKAAASLSPRKNRSPRIRTLTRSSTRSTPSTPSTRGTQTGACSSSRKVWSTTTAPTTRGQSGKARP